MHFKVFKCISLLMPCQRASGFSNFSLGMIWIVIEYQVANSMWIIFPFKWIAHPFIAMTILTNKMNQTIQWLKFSFAEINIAMRGVQKEKKVLKKDFFFKSYQFHITYLLGTLNCLWYLTTSSSFSHTIWIRPLQNTLERFPKTLHEIFMYFFVVKRLAL